MLKAQADDEVGSRACANCHPEIARKYFAASMAQSSGKVGEGPIPETFDRAHFSDPGLEADYRVSLSADGYRLEFSREATGARGDCVLRWFVGSGRVARSYILSREGFLFQAPVSFYLASDAWAVSPGFEQHQSIHFTRAVTTKCLQCHASGLRIAAPAGLSATRRELPPPALTVLIGSYPVPARFAGNGAGPTRHDVAGDTERLRLTRVDPSVSQQHVDENPKWACLKLSCCLRLGLLRPTRRAINLIPDDARVPDTSRGVVRPVVRQPKRLAIRIERGITPTGFAREAKFLSFSHV